MPFDLQLNGFAGVDFGADDLRPCARPARPCAPRGPVWRWPRSSPTPSTAWRRGVAAGLSGFTHLGNGCPHLLPRHDNVIHRVLACDALRWITFIPDGVHVPAAALGNYLRLAGLERAIAVTDATAAAGMGPGTFRLGTREVVVGDDGVAWSADRTHLVGSTATMAGVVRFLADSLGLGTDAIERLTATNPEMAVATPPRLAGRPAGAPP